MFIHYPLLVLVCHSLAPGATVQDETLPQGNRQRVSHPCAEPAHGVTGRETKATAQPGARAGQ